MLHERAHAAASELQRRQVPVFAVDVHLYGNRVPRANGGGSEREVELWELERGQGRKATG